MTGASIRPRRFGYRESDERSWKWGIGLRRWRIYHELQRNRVRANLNIRKPRRGRLPHFGRFNRLMNMKMRVAVQRMEAAFEKCNKGFYDLGKSMEVAASAFADFVATVITESVLESIKAGGELGDVQPQPPLVK